MFAVHRPKFFEKLFFLFSGGVISTPFPALGNAILSYLLMYNFPRFNAALISIVIIAPLLEEFAKAYPLFYRHGETRHSILTLGFLTGLGFGITEFLLYVYIYQASWILRLPLIFFHATNTVITSYGIGVKKALPFYLIAFVLHMSYNLSLILSGDWLYVSAISIFVSFILAIFLYSKVKKPPKFIEVLEY